MGRRVGAIAALAASMAVSASAQTTAAFAGIPNVQFGYYDVAGRDAAAIRTAIDARRPIDPNDGRRVDALSHGEWRWTWRAGRKGCDLAAATIEFRGSVLLPRLDPAVILMPADRALWDRYIAALEAHEAWHMRNAYDGRLDVLAAIKAASCATANDVAKAAVAAINARDVAYDKATDHGKIGGAVF